VPQLPDLPADGQGATTSTTNPENGNVDGYVTTASLGNASGASTTTLSAESGWNHGSVAEVAGNKAGTFSNIEPNLDYDGAGQVDGDVLGHGGYAASSDDHGNHTATAYGSVNWESADGNISISGQGTGRLANYGLEVPTGDLTATVNGQTYTWHL